jgi:hypothetical protein
MLTVIVVEVMAEVEVMESIMKMKSYTIDTNGRDCSDGKRIRVLERQLIEARMDSMNEEEREESEALDSFKASDEDQDLNPWENPNRGRNQRFRIEHDQCFQNLGAKIDISEFDGKSHPVSLLTGCILSSRFLM